jgi:hypothetical protein
VRELGAQGSEVAGGAAGRDGGGGFDGDVAVILTEGVEQIMDAAGDHGLAASDHDVAGTKSAHLGEDFGHGHFAAFRLPRGIWGVAPRATQVAPRRADEDRREADEFTFALDGVKDFGNEHEERINIPRPTFNLQRPMAGALAWGEGEVYDS